MIPQGGGQFCLVFSDSGDTTSLIGDTLMASFVTVFDVGGKRIGFAPEVGCASTPAVATSPRALVPGQPWWATEPRFQPKRR